MAALDLSIKRWVRKSSKRESAQPSIIPLEQAAPRLVQDALHFFESAMARVQVPFNKICMLKRLQPFTRLFYTPSDERLEFFRQYCRYRKSRSPLVSVPLPFVVNPQNITKIDKEAKKAFLKMWGQLLISRDQV